MRPSSCPSGKVGYADRLVADAALARIAKCDPRGHRERWAYPCPICGELHLTHLRPGRGASKRRKARARREREG